MTTTVEEATPVAPAPAKGPGLLRLNLVRNGFWALVALVVGYVAVYMVSDYTVGQVAMLMAYIVAGFGLTMLVGGNGQISLGHAALMAVGAYTMAKFLGPRATDLNESTLGLLVAGLVLAMVITTLIGVLVGMAAARLRGPYLAGATLALGVAFPGLTNYFHDTFNGEQGLPIPSPEIPPSLFEAGWLPDRFVALIGVVLVAVTLFFVANLKRSEVGRHFGAVRDNEIAAQLCGLSVARTQVAAFAISAATAGLGGAVLGLWMQNVNPHSFGLVVSLSLLGAVVIGGLGSLRGVVWGSVIIVFLHRLFEELKDGSSLPLSSGVLDNLPLAAYGLLLIVVMLVVPGGIQGLVARLTARLPRRNPQPQGVNS